MWTSQLPELRNVDFATGPGPAPARPPAQENAPPPGPGRSNPNACHPATPKSPKLAPDGPRGPPRNVRLIGGIRSHLVSSKTIVIGPIV